MENTIVVPQNLNTALPFHLELTLLGIYTKEFKVGTQKDICTIMFITAYSQLPKGENHPHVRW